MIEPGSPAPDADIDAVTGNRVRLSESFSEGPTLLVFFKEECGACMVAMPRMPRVVEAYPNLRVWAISQESAADTWDYLETHAPGLPALVDAPDYEVSRAYGIESVPSFFVIEDGIVVDADSGWDRDRFNALTGAAGKRAGHASRQLVGDDDGPPFRPG